MPASSHSLPVGHHRSVLPEFEIYITGSREYRIFCVWRLSMLVLLVRSFRLFWIIVGSSSPLYAILSWYSRPFAVDGHLGCFEFLCYFEWCAKGCCGPGLRMGSACISAGEASLRGIAVSRSRCTCSPSRDCRFSEWSYRFLLLCLRMSVPAAPHLCWHFSILMNCCILFQGIDVPLFLYYMEYGWEHFST